MTRPLALAILALLAFATGAPAAERALDEPEALAVSPDGRSLYVAGDRTVTFARDPQTGALTQIADLEPGGRTVAVAPDGRTVYVAGTSLHVLARDPQSGVLTHLRSYVDGDDPAYGVKRATGLAVSPDGRQLFLTTQGDNALFVFDRDPSTGLLTFREARAGRATEHAAALALAPDGSSLYVAAAPGVGVFRRDPATGALSSGAVVENPWNGVHAAVAVTPDGATVLAGLGEYTAFRRGTDGGLSEPRPVDTMRDGCIGCSIGRSIASTSDRSVYAIDSRRAVVSHVVLAPEGDDVREPVGVRAPRALVVAPDERFVHVLSSTGRGDDRTGVETLRRDPATGDLSTAGSVPARVSSFVPSGRPEPFEPLSVTINDGALYTNDPEVTVVVSTPPPGFASLSIAGDGGFGGAVQRARTDGRYPFTLAPGRPERTVRRVFVSPTRADRWSWTDEALTDDIVLDQRRPVVQEATLGEGVLRLRARDERSGVRSIQLAGAKRRPGRLRPFRRAVRVGAAAARFVRVRDGAGNASAWRAVRRR